VIHLISLSVLRSNSAKCQDSDATAFHILAFQAPIGSW
jgi:hypothetical protein